MHDQITAEPPYRWVILGTFAFTLLTMALQTFTLSSISIAVERIYSVDEIFVELCSFIFFINYAIFLIPAYYFDEYFDTRRSLLLGCLISFLGAFVRIGAIFSFWWIMIGSFISSISQPFIANQITKLSVLWFRSERRATATSISMIFFIMGQGGSFAVSGGFVRDDSTKTDVFLLMTTECILAFLSLLLIFFFFRDRCIKSISFLRLMETGNIKSDLKELSRNKNFIYLFLSSIISCGNANFWAVLMAYVTGYYGVGPSETSILGTVSTMAGLIMCYVTAYLASWQKRYKPICVITLGLAVPLYFLFFFIQQIGIFELSVLVAACFGSSIMPIYSLSLELACEVAFPVREVITSGLINCASQIFGLIPIFVAWLFGNDVIFVVGLAMGLQLVSVGLMCMVKEKHKRSFAETMSFARVLMPHEFEEDVFLQKR